MIADGTWRVAGRGVGGLVEPDGRPGHGQLRHRGAFCAASWRAIRLFAVMTGDGSLPAAADAAGDRSAVGLWRSVQRARRRTVAACRWNGSADALPLEYGVPVPSAQVKSACLLCGLNARGAHPDRGAGSRRATTARTCSAISAPRFTSSRQGGGASSTLHGQPELRAAGRGGAGRSVLGCLPLVAAALVVPGLAADHREASG